MTLLIFLVDTRKKVMFEYLVIKSKNDSLDAAKKLVKLLTGFTRKENLVYILIHMLELLIKDLELI